MQILIELKTGTYLVSLDVLSIYRERASGEHGEIKAGDKGSEEGEGLIKAGRLNERVASADGIIKAKYPRIYGGIFCDEADTASSA